MRVQFDATLDDMVDAAFREVSRSRSLSRSRRWDYLAVSIVAGILAGITTYLVIPDTREIRLVLAGVAAVGSAAITPIAQRLSAKRRVRAYLREKLGSETPFNVEVELSREGVSANQKTGKVILAWHQIDSIHETTDSIDILPRHGGIIVVRKRAFASNEMMQQFIQEAQSYLALARERPTKN